MGKTAIVTDTSRRTGLAIANGFAKAGANLVLVVRNKSALEEVAKSLKDALELERLAFSILYSSDDQKEGMRAFIEKRKPQWKGK